MLVIIVFACVLILGTGLIATTMASERNAIYQKENQQAYYAAKSVVDTFLDYLVKLGHDDQEDLIGATGSLMNKTSDPITIQDNRSGNWECKVQIRPGGGGKVEVVGTSYNASTGARGEVVGVVKEDMSTLTSSLISHDKINIDSTKSLSMVDIMTEGGGAKLKVNGNLSAKNIQTFGDTKIETTGTGVLSVADVITGAGPAVITAGQLGGNSGSPVELSGAQGVSVGNIFGNGISIKAAAGDITIGGNMVSSGNISLEVTGSGEVDLSNKTIVAFGTFTIKCNDPSQIKNYDLTKIYTSDGKINVDGGTDITGAQGYDGAVMQNTKNALPIRALIGITEPVGPLAPLVFTPWSDVTIYNCPTHNNCLLAEYFETAFASSFHEEHLSADTNASPHAYRFNMPATSEIYFGVKRSCGHTPTGHVGACQDITVIGTTDPQIVGIDRLHPSTGEKQIFKIFTEEATQPFGIHFYNNENIRYCGNFYPNNGGLNIKGDTEGLSFGSISYVFEKYKEK